MFLCVLIAVESISPATQGLGILAKSRFIHCKQRSGEFIKISCCQSNHDWQARMEASRHRGRMPGQTSQSCRLPGWPVGRQGSKQQGRQGGSEAGNKVGMQESKHSSEQAGNLVSIFLFHISTTCICVC